MENSCSIFNVISSSSKLNEELYTKTAMEDFNSSTVQIKQENNEDFLVQNGVRIKEEELSSCEETVEEESLPGEEFDANSDKGLHFVTQTKQENNDYVLLQNGICIKEEVSIEDETVEEESLHNEILDVNSDSGLQLTQLGVPESTQMKLDSSYKLFIKEEFSVDKENCESELKQQTDHITTEDEAFGEHFLSQCLEQSGPQYEYANGQPAGIEWSSFVTDGLLDSHNSNQTSGIMQDFYGSEEVSDQPMLDDIDALDSSEQDTVQMGRQACKQCDYTCDPQKLCVHQQNNNHIKTPIFCQFCPFQSMSKNCIRTHTIKKHSFGVMPIDCPYCKYRSLSIMDVEDHIEKKHRAPRVYPFCCPYCDHRSGSRSNRAYHIASKHTREMNFFCPYCDYKCILESRIKLHVLKIHKKKVKNACLLKM